MTFRKRSAPDLPAAISFVPFSSDNVDTISTRRDLEVTVSGTSPARGSDLETSTLSGGQQRSPYNKTRDDCQFTGRAVLAGLAVGTVVCFSNMYFGLQSGSSWSAELAATLRELFFFYSGLGLHDVDARVIDWVRDIQDSGPQTRLSVHPRGERVDADCRRRSGLYAT